jgi:hypothetical protein
MVALGVGSLDHEKLTCPHSGRDERLTDVAERVVEQVMG